MQVSCVSTPPLVFHVTTGTMRLRVRKASQQPTPPPPPPTRSSQAKRKHSEVDRSIAPATAVARMQKNETGLFSTIKRFIRGNAVKVRYRNMLWCV